MTELIKEQPDLTLEEIGQRLGLSCTIEAVHYILKEMGISYKKDAESQRARSRRHCNSVEGLEARPR